MTDEDNPLSCLGYLALVLVGLVLALGITFILSHWDQLQLRLSHLLGL